MIPEPAVAVRVLVVDDEAANVVLLERILRRQGYADIISTTDPREAIRLYRERGADVVLLDLHMPGLDGFGVMRELEALRPADELLPVVVITADVTPDTRNRALSAGATDFITKPIDITEVQLRVSNLARTRVLHERVRQQKVAYERELDAQAALLAAEEQARRDRRTRIEGILERGGPRIVFQPIVHVGTGVLVGCEALSRFPFEAGRPPDHWFREAAEVGLGLELELAAVERAHDSVLELPPGCRLSVNASAEAAMSPAMHDLLGSVAPERVILEVTEHQQVTDYQALVERCRALRAMGAQVAVDDAGAGFAGLQHILRLQPDVIKLDRFLVTGIDADPARRALAGALVGFAREIGASVTAEGIETAAELSVVAELGIEHGQGLFIGAPEPLEVLSVLHEATRTAN